MGIGTIIAKCFLVMLLGEVAIGSFTLGNISFGLVLLILCAAAIQIKTVDKDELPLAQNVISNWWYVLAGIFSYIVSRAVSNIGNLPVPMFLLLAVTIFAAIIIYESKTVKIEKTV